MLLGFIRFYMLKPYFYVLHHEKQPLFYFFLAPPLKVGTAEQFTDI